MAQAAERGTDVSNRLSMASWLAEDDGIPYAVQHLYNLEEYEQQAREIEDMRKKVRNGE